MRIMELLNAIVVDLEGRITDLETCQWRDGPLDPSDPSVIDARAPAIYLALDGSTEQDAFGVGERDATLDLSAFVVTADRRDLTRFEAAVKLVEALLVHVPDNRWGLAGVFGARRVSARNLHGAALDRRGLALWRVAWCQTIRLGESFRDAEGVLPTARYLGLAPAVGKGREADYRRIPGDRP